MNKVVAIATLFATLALSACGGGAQTTENLEGTGNNNGGGTTATKPPYTGPRPATPTFRISAWSFGKTLAARTVAVPATRPMAARRRTSCAGTT